MLYYIFLGIIVFAGFAMTVQMGVWNNLITLMAILVGGVVAFGVHQPLAVLLDEKTDGSYTYILDFPILWLTFALTVGLIKEIAAMLSRNRVNFPDPIDNFGGAAIGFVAALALAGFSMATFHAAPLSYDALGGKLEYGVTTAEAERSLSEASILSPDAAWLRLTESVLSKESMGSAGFSAKIFVSQHGAHRKNFQSLESTIVKRS